MRPAVILRSVKPALPKLRFREGASFDRNFPSGKQPKVWDNKDRDEFFRKKYAHLHARQIKRRENSNERHALPVLSKGLDKPKSNVKQKTSKPQLISFNEYIYGKSSVLAALVGTKRTGLTVLYTSKSAVTADLRIVQAAKKRNVLIEYETPKNKMDQLTSNGIHNGYALRVRPLVLPQAESLVFNEFENSNIDLENQEESTYGIVEHKFEKPTLVPHKLARADLKSNAVGIYIDEVTDPHNLGAILRSAQFLGADFAIVSTLNCSKLSPVVSKVSAGALETFSIYSCEAPLKLFEKSKLQGWNIIAAVPPSISVPTATRIKPSELSIINIDAPSLLVVGSEGDGLRKALLQRCTHVVSISNGSANLTDIENSDVSRNNLLDSLNVSVASALLISRFMKD